mgnify:CR=1 FL=1
MDTFYKILLFMILTTQSYSLYGQEKVLKKIAKTYTMTNAGKLTLENKYGDVIINGWDKNSIKITVNIKVVHRKKENAKSLLDRINIDVKNTNDFVLIRSEIADKNTGFFAKYFNKANPFDYDKTNIQIDYEIYMPLNAEVNISNKFGDVILEDFTGKLKATVQHGDMWINDDLTNASLDVKFGKLDAKSILYGSIRLKNGELNLENSDNLRIDSSGTIIHIDSVSLLEIYSSKDNITINKLSEIKGEFQFSKVYLNTVEKEIKLSMNLADFKVDNIIKRDAIIKINQVSSDLNINITNLAFSFNAKLEQGLLRIPKSFKNLKTTILDKGRKIRQITAGYGKKTSGKISFTGRKGIILLSE